jgi:hypothetical protein
MPRVRCLIDLPNGHQVVTIEHVAALAFNDSHYRRRQQS